MTKTVFKTIFAGIVIGTAFFFIPFFLLKVFLFFLIIGGLFRLFMGRRFGPRFHPAYADKIRNMSDEEYQQFKQRIPQGCGRYHRNEQTRKETA